MALHESGKKVLATNLSTVCQLLKLNVNVVKNHRSRVGEDTPYNGWLFISDPDERLIEG